MAGGGELQVLDCGKRKRLKLILKVMVEHCENLRLKKQSARKQVSQQLIKERTIEETNLKSPKNYFMYSPTLILKEFE